MNRVLIAVAAVAAGLSGCMTPAHYIEHGKDQGIVAIPEWTNEWPSHYKDAALELIKQHVGPNYDIVSTYTVVVGSPGNAPRMSSDPAAPGANPSSTKTEYRIVYQKRNLPPGSPLANQMGNPFGPRPLPPAGTGLGAGTVPAGAYVPGSVTGTGSMSQGPGMIPSVGPAGYIPPPPTNPYSVPGGASPTSAYTVPGGGR